MISMKTASAVSVSTSVKAPWATGGFLFARIGLLVRTLLAAGALKTEGDRLSLGIQGGA